MSDERNRWICLVTKKTRKNKARKGRSRDRRGAWTRSHVYPLHPCCHGGSGCSVRHSRHPLALLLLCSSTLRSHLVTHPPPCSRVRPALGPRSVSVQRERDEEGRGEQSTEGGGSPLTRFASPHHSGRTSRSRPVRPKVPRYCILQTWSLPRKRCKVQGKAKRARWLGACW